MSEIEKYYNGEIIVDFEEETELEKKYNEVVELYSKAVKKKIEYRKEIERLNKLISQREKKWEKWTTEKTILSTKMSDYLCKYQNIKREYTKQIKISTDRKKEIERLNNIINELERFMDEDYEYYKKYGYAEQGHAMGQIRRIKNKLQELKGENKK